MPVETELKLRIRDGETDFSIYADKAVVSGRMEQWRDIEMRSEYYDTPERDLLSRGWTLRLRHEDGEPVVAFKQKGFQESFLFFREEWQTPAASVEEALPILASRGAPAELLDFSGFSGCCTVNFTRRVTKLTLSDGSIVELALDSGEINAGGASQLFHELEMELLAGEPDRMVELGLEWERDYGLEREPDSKYARALKMMEESGATPCDD